MRFALLISRWTIPSACASSRASAIWLAIRKTTGTESGPRVMRSESGSPSTSSITMKRSGPSSPMSKVVATAGERSAEAARASLSRRARRSGVAAVWCGDELQSDLASEARIPGAKHFAHPPGTDAVFDLVVLYGGARAWHGGAGLETPFGVRDHENGRLASMLPYDSRFARAMTDTSTTLDDSGSVRFEELRRRAGLVLAPVMFFGVLLVPFDSLSPEAHIDSGRSWPLVITLWVTEALPLAITALIGPTLAVVLQVATVRDAFAPMANPLIFLFIGSFILAQGLFVHRVNERIAYGVLSMKVIGARPTRILIAYGALAAFLSAWMSNTATAAMLVPIGISLVAFMESEGKLPKSYGTALMLMTAYGCSRGGMATPVGTPPNLIAIGMLDDLLGIRITFVEWMLMAVPVTLVLMGDRLRLSQLDRPHRSQGDPGG